MKKITSLLALFLVVLGINAQGQAPSKVIGEMGKDITKIEQLVDGQYYILKNLGRQKAVYVDANSNLMMGTDYGVGKGSAYIWQAHNIDGKFAFSTLDNKYFSTPCQPGNAYISVVEEAAKDAFIVTPHSSNNYKGWKLESTLETQDVNRFFDGNSDKFVGWQGKGDNSVYAFCPVTVVDASSIANYTYSYQYNGVEFKSVKAIGVPGKPCEILPLDQDFVKYTLVDPNQKVAQDAVVKINVEAEALPFELSTADKTVWYVVDIHNHNTRFMKSSQETNVSVVDIAPENMVAELAKDEFQWCFKGNPVTGIKVYNKAQAGKALGNEGKIEESKTQVQFLDEAKAYDWKLKKSRVQGMENAACFYNQKARLFWNHQGGVLKYWRDNDEGSSCRFYLPAQISDMATAIASEKLIREAKALVPAFPGCVGSKAYFAGNIDAYNAAIAALEADKMNVEKKAALEELVAAANADPRTVELVAGKLYRIKNVIRLLAPNGPNNSGNHDAVGKGGYMGTSPYPGLNNDIRPVSCGTNQLNDAGTVWQFVPQGNGYRLLNLNADAYLGGEGNKKDNFMTMQKTDPDQNAGTFVLDDKGNGKFRIGIDPASNKVLHASNSSLMLWDNGSDPASQWYIIPATELEVDMTEGWASLYLPFGIKMAEGVKAYAGKVNGNKLVLTDAGAEIPAENGVLLNGTEAKYTLTITELAFGNVEHNDLVGSNVADPMDANSLVLGKGENGIGMYHPSNANMKINKAFVPAAAGVNALSLVFGDVTGVEGVEVATPADNVYYDLSGRRVSNPVKGIYVVNGKKVYVK